MARAARSLLHAARPMNKLSLAGAVTLAVLTAACTADIDLTSPDPVADDASERAASDVVSIPFTRFEDSGAPDEPGALPFTTAEDYRDYFGHDAPGVAWDHEWVVSYAADEQTTESCAAIRKIEYSRSTRRLTVYTQVRAPGADCPAPTTLSRPSVLVKFAVPSPEPLYFNPTSDAPAEGPQRPGDPGNACADRTGGALVTIEVGNTASEQFRAWVTKPSFIAEAHRLQTSGETRNPTFTVVDGTGCDARWTFSVDAAEAEFAEVNTEVCDALPSDVEDHKAAWIGKTWCPWGSRVVSVEDR